MSPRHLAAFRLPTELLAAMRTIRDTERIPMTAQIELALEAWLKARGTAVNKAATRRTGTRRKG